MNIEKLTKIAEARGNPCVSISLNTHRTHPENKQDAIALKNLCAQAEQRLVDEFGKRDIANILSALNKLPSEIDINHNLDSLHIFLSNDMQETVKSPWPCTQNSVQISEQFAVRDLIKVYNRSEVYLVLRLSQGGVQLYRAINDAILEEVRNDDFPFKENPHYNTQTEKKSDAKLADNLVREFLNKVDKALVKVHNETNLYCVVIATEDNYSRLMQVADKPSLYYGYCPINYNADAPHQMVSQSWGMVEKMQYERRTAAIAAMREAVASGSVLTDLQDIYQAAIDGRADVLIVHEDYKQPVLMTSERTFEYIDDVNIPNAIDDVVSVIAWEVLSKKGRVIFTQQEQINDLGSIVLKTRF